MRRLIPLVVCAVLAACGGVPEREEPPAGAGAYAGPDRLSRNAGVIGLADGADEALDRGEPEQAASLLERALRIEPRNAGLWLRLARTRLALDDYDEAEQLARRAISLVPGHTELQARAWRLISEIRRARGDMIGGATAAQKARRLENG